MKTVRSVFFKKIIFDLKALIFVYTYESEIKYGMAISWEKPRPLT